MPHIKAKHLNPQQGTGYHAAFDGIANDTIAQNDLVIANGVDGNRIKWVRAAANNAAARIGVMGIADHAATSGGRLRVVSHKVITGVDTSGSTAAGHAIYLSDTPGSWGTSAGTATIVVGSVLVDDNTTGALVLAPAHSVGIE